MPRFAVLNGRAICILVGLAFAHCNPADATPDSPDSPDSPLQANRLSHQLPEKLGAPLQGFLEERVDTSGTVRTRLPEVLSEAPFVAYDGQKLRFYDDGEDNSYDSYEPAPEQDRVFWKGRFRPIFAKELILPDGQTRPLVSLRFAGAFITEDEGDSYRPVFTGLPRRSTPASASPVSLYRDLMDFWQNPDRPDEIVGLNKHEVLYSRDGGTTFRKFRMPRGDLDKATLSVLTARRDARGDITELWIGTYLRGIVRCVPSTTRDANGVVADWRALGCRQITTRGLPSLIHETGSYFREEISGIAYAANARAVKSVNHADGNSASKPNDGLLIWTARFQAGLGLFDPNRRGGVHEFFPLPGFSGADHAESLFYDPREQTAWISTNRGLYSFSLKDRRFRHVPRSELFGGEVSLDAPPLDLITGVWPGGEGRVVFSNYLGQGTDGQKAAGHEQFGRTPTNLRAMYISPTSARRKQRMVFDLLDNYGFNAAVIDVKDDFGRLTYGSKLPEAKAMRNDRKRVDVAGLVKKLKARGVYTIARQVVFKDKVLFGYAKNKYAIRDRAGGAWVGSGEERWVDTFSDWVHDYNVRIGQELVELGFDEIQFDYIRFPSDGPIGRCVWKYRKGDAYKSEALENFLMKARRKLTKPISVDIYGYHGIYRAGTVIGQDMIDVGEFVDVVSPMHYSSHFGNRYLDHIPKDRRAYELLKLGTERPLRMGQGRFQVRPWIQAFKMKISIWGWGDPYMRNQILGSVHGGASGFLWWGPIKEFYLPGRVQNQLVSPSADR